MKVKVGDNVKILAGKDKDKTGKVIRTLSPTLTLPARILTLSLLVKIKVKLAK